MSTPDKARANEACPGCGVVEGQPHVAFCTHLSQQLRTHAPTSVDAMIADISAFLADAPNGKPHTGYRYGELLEQAAAALAAMQERIAELERDFDASVWKSAKEQTERLQREHAAEIAAHNGAGWQLRRDKDGWEDRAKRAEAALRQAEADARRWNQARSQPEAMSHLLRLLAQEKGTPAKLDEMVDKIIMQRNAIARKLDAAQGAKD